MCYERNLETVRHCTNANDYYFLTSPSLFSHKLEREETAAGAVKEEGEQAQRGTQEPVGDCGPCLDCGAPLPGSGTFR